MILHAKCSDIIWDTDGEPHELPSEITVEVEVEADDDVEEAISDALSNKTGFCHKGFTYDIVPPSIDTVTTEGEGRQLAKDWQHWQSDQSLSWGDVANWGAFFEQVADKFPGLKDEFKENAIC